MPQCSIYLNDELYMKIMKHGKRSELISELLTNYFERQEKKEKRE